MLLFCLLSTAGVEEEVGVSEGETGGLALIEEGGQMLLSGNHMQTERRLDSLWVTMPVLYVYVIRTGALSVGLRVVGNVRNLTLHPSHLSASDD